MSDKNNQTEIIKTGTILFLITAVAAFALAIVNSVTAPVIEGNNAKKQAAAMKNVLKDAAEFSQLTLDSQIDKSVSAIYSAKNAQGDLVGVCVSVTSSGYGGDIDMIVGVSTDKKVTGVDIISQSETAGLGTKAAEPAFKDQYIGKGKIDKVVKSGAKENEIDAISGATITSKAVTKGVNTAVSAAEEVLAKEALK
ncbi:MAG: RnfABCDGE type electron transport complex subunit G [Clostridia bacterium]|nr:RnfABCDGE type electron transport complex subunit G [Clostridia bacterium]